MAECFLSLGSNKGKRNLNLTDVVKNLSFQGVKIIKSSKIYSTEPYGTKEQKDFLNQVVKTNFSGTVEELLEITMNIENKMGRIRTEKWGPRIIDIDILLFDDLKINSTALTVPHPELHKRKFVLIPFAEISPETIHPVFNKTVKELLQECADCSKVEPRE